MLTQLASLATVGLTCERITVEVGSAPGEGNIFIVGLGDTAVQESKQRVRMALRVCGFRIPTGRTITINLAPANVKKNGARYDLAIALGILLSCEVIALPREALEGTVFLGELGLDGTLRHVPGVLPAAIACTKLGVRRIIVPAVNGSEAALIPGIEVIAAETLPELLQILRGERMPARIAAPARVTPSASNSYAAAVHSERAARSREIETDFADVRGQLQAKRALEIAAAGGHNVLLCGAPGAGKTLLAQAFRGILPPMTEEEAIDVTQIYSVANLLPIDTPLLRERPFRAVHHTASAVSIVGGGQTLSPGEISLAHRGVLFMDELAEFPRHVLEVLRQPLEDRTITITRAQGAITYPADFIMIAAMNPPENIGDAAARRLQRRISPPLLDRIDLTVDIQPVPMEDLERAPREEAESSATICVRVIAARERQKERFRGLSLVTNKEMSVRQLRDFCVLDDASEHLLSSAIDRLKLSARGYHRTIKVARTIADLEGASCIGSRHIAEALQYRQLLHV
jgi:magnesium chelatase family protein